MITPLIVSGDPRKISRSSTVLVAPGKYNLVHDFVTTLFEIVVGGVNRSENEFDFSSPTMIFVRITTPGAEPSINISLHKV